MAFLGVFEHIPLSFTFLVNWHLDEKPHGSIFNASPSTAPIVGEGIYTRRQAFGETSKAETEVAFPEVAFGTLPAS